MDMSDESLVVKKVLFAKLNYCISTGFIFKIVTQMKIKKSITPCFQAGVLMIGFERL